jgi:hypothetical protein
MRTERCTLLLRATLLSSICLLAAASASAQSAPPAATCQPSPTPIAAPPAATAAASNEAGGIRVFLLGPDKKPLARKRLFLIQRSAFSAGGLDWASMPKRADYLQGASPQLREWLTQHDCDSLYCPGFESEFAEAVKTVPEFKRAYDDGLRKYRNERLALKWLPANFPLKNVRSEYFRRKRAWLEEAGRKTGKVISFMTDEKGRAIFSGFKPGEYYVSNLIPLEEGGPVWDCKVTTLPPNPRQMWAVTYVLNTPARQSATSP